jgi:hypothetical protein
VGINNGNMFKTILLIQMNSCNELAVGLQVNAPGTSGAGRLQAFINEQPANAQALEMRNNGHLRQFKLAIAFIKQGSGAHNFIILPCKKNISAFAEDLFLWIVKHSQVGLLSETVLVQPFKVDCSEILLEAGFEIYYFDQC